MQLAGLLPSVRILKGMTGKSCRKMMMKSSSAMENENQLFAFEIHATRGRQVGIWDPSHFYNGNVPKISQGHFIAL